MRIVLLVFPNVPRKSSRRCSSQKRNATQLCKVPQFSRHGEGKDDSLLEDGSRKTVSTDPLMKISSHIAKSM